MIEANIDHHQTCSETEQAPSTTTSLFQILLNRIVFDNIIPYLPASSLLSLASTCQSFRGLIYESPGTFRHLDLTNLNAAQLSVVNKLNPGSGQCRNVLSTSSENITDEDFYSEPLRWIFSTLENRNILQDVQTLILDGLSVTAELCHEIINNPAYNVKLLSILGAKNLNHRKLCGALSYACRTSRPEGTPSLKALYVFGSKGYVDTNATPTSTPNVSAAGPQWNLKSHQSLSSSSLQKDGDAWWSQKGRIIPSSFTDEWANSLLSCQGIIAFDAVLCHGPRHTNSPVFGALPLRHHNAPALATFALPPCTGCGKCPEGMTDISTNCDRSSRFPLLSPPPLLSSRISAAIIPQGSVTPFTPRCHQCIQDRYCNCCHKWWCESCYALEGSASVKVADNTAEEEVSETVKNMISAMTNSKPKAHVSKSCWECGNSCKSCVDKTQRTCRKCFSGYCIIHNEGSSAAFCDWCVSRGRGLGRL